MVSLFFTPYLIENMKLLAKSKHNPAGFGYKQARWSIQLENVLIEAGSFINFALGLGDSNVAAIIFLQKLVGF